MTLTVNLSVKVQPGAGRNAVVGRINGIWKIKIAAPPDKGKANKELVDFLSGLLNIRKDQINILKGQTSHNKIITVAGLDEAEIARRLQPESKI
jgi:uncharacterized protein